MYGVNANVQVDDKVCQSSKGINCEDIEVEVDRPVASRNIDEVRGILPNLGRSNPMLLKRLK